MSKLDYSINTLLTPLTLMLYFYPVVFRRKHTFQLLNNMDTYYQNSFVGVNINMVVSQQLPCTLFSKVG